MTTVSGQHGLCCPQCKLDEDLRVSASLVVRLTPDGVDQAGDHEWHDTSWVFCDSCGFEGEAADFAVVDYPAQALVKAVRRLLVSVTLSDPTGAELRRLLRHFDEDGEPN